MAIKECLLTKDGKWFDEIDMANSALNVLGYDFQTTTCDKIKSPADLRL